MKLKKTRGFINDFKAFIMRGNVIDMAIGVIIAGAFGKITTSLVNDIFMPLIGWIIGDLDLSKYNIELVAANAEKGKEAVVLNIGALLVAIIDFLIIAFVVFLIIKAFAKAKELAEKRNAEAAEEAAAEDPKPTTEELLTEILAEIKKK